MKEGDRLAVWCNEVINDANKNIKGFAKGILNYFQAIYQGFISSLSNRPIEAAAAEGAGQLRCANLAARFIVKDLIKFFETKDDLLTLSLGSRFVFSQDKFSLLNSNFSSNLSGIS